MHKCSGAKKYGSYCGSGWPFQYCHQSASGRPLRGQSGRFSSLVYAGGQSRWALEKDHHGQRSFYKTLCICGGGVLWQCSQGKDATVIHLVLTTIAYALCEENLVELESIHNRPEDVAWARQKLIWLWQASVASEECRLL